MSSAPALRIIEGGRGEAPPIPPAIEGERLYPIFSSLERPGAFVHVVAVSLVVHGVVLLASVGWNILGEERALGGSEELVVIEGVDLILLDQMPSTPAPLAEARQIAESDVAEETPASEAHAIVADRRATEVAADSARQSQDSPPAAVNETVSTLQEPSQTASVLPSEIAETDFAIAEEVAAEATIADDPSREVAVVPFASAEPTTADAAPFAAADSRASTVAVPPADAVRADTVAQSPTVSVDPTERDRDTQVIEAMPAPWSSNPAEEMTPARHAAQAPGRQLVPEPQERPLELVRAPAAAPVGDDAALALDGGITAPPVEGADATPGPAALASEEVAVADDGSLRPRDELSQAAVNDRSFQPKNDASRAAADDRSLRPTGDARTVVADDRSLRPTEDMRPVAAREQVLKPAGDERGAALDDQHLQPTGDPSLVAAEEVLPDPPLPRENQLELVEAKPKAKTAAAPVAPNASAAASAASPTARGPAKAKAGAGGKSKNAQGQAILTSYQSKLVAHLRRFRSYPAAARSRRIEGTASLQITIGSNGKVIAVSLARSTGHDILDRAAVAMARRASPFPPIPPSLRRSKITIRAPIRFDIR